MGLMPFDETRHAPDSFFISHIDGKKYLKLTAKEPYRFHYAYDLLRTKVLSFGDKGRTKEFEKMPPEAGYSLNFDVSVVRFKNNDLAGVETFVELSADCQKYGCYSLGKYYAKTIDDIFKDATIDFLSGPPRGGVSVEVAACMNSKRQDMRFYHFTSDMLAKQIYRKDAPKTILVYPDHVSIEDSSSVLVKKGSVLICDDCLITGNSIRREAKALQEKTELKDLNICGVLVGIDCGFYGKSGKRVSEELEEEIGVKVESIVDIEELVDNFYNQLPVTHYPVRDFNEWTLDKDSMVTPEYIETCNAMLHLFEQEVCKSFGTFMKTQREAISIEETLRRLRA